MAKLTTKIYSGYILEDDSQLTLRQLCDVCTVRVDYIIKLVDEGLIEPSGEKKSHWCFDGVTIKRVQQAKRLQNDLGINTAGVALAIELMDEINLLRAQLIKM